MQNYVKEIPEEHILVFTNENWRELSGTERMEAAKSYMEDLCNVWDLPMPKTVVLGDSVMPWLLVKYDRYERTLYLNGEYEENVFTNEKQFASGYYPGVYFCVVLTYTLIHAELAYILKHGKYKGFDGADPVYTDKVMRSACRIRLVNLPEYKLPVYGWSYVTEEHTSLAMLDDKIVEFMHLYNPVERTAMSSAKNICMQFADLWNASDPEMRIGEPYIDEILGGSDDKMLEALSGAVEILNKYENGDSLHPVPAHVGNNISAGLQETAKVYADDGIQDAKLEALMHATWAAAAHPDEAAVILSDENLETDMTRLSKKHHGWKLTDACISVVNGKGGA